MLDFLRWILDGIAAIGQLVLWAVVSAINGLIAALGAVASAFVSLLPGLPDAPNGPGEGIVGWLTWVIPLGPLFAGLTLFVGLWLGFLAVRWALRVVRFL